MSERASILHNLATEMEQAGRLSEALASYREASAANPTSPFLRYNIATMLRRLKRFEEAISVYDEAIALRPEFPMAHFMRASCLLQLGRLPEGFQAMEWRKDAPTYEDPRYGLPRQWAGESLASKTLFIYPELFQGDMLQFCRYALLAEMAGAQVILAAQEPMHAILRSMSRSMDLLPAEAVPADYDYASALMSLPAAFGTTLNTVPAGVYLHADPARVETWRARIGDRGLKIGVAWQGSAQASLRSFPLAALEPLARVPGVRLISLQKGGGLDQLAALPAGMVVEDLGAGFDAGSDLFLDTAAAMACCDLFVTPDTSVAHLAGALGVTTWIALPHLADWRWLEGRADTPWYPTAMLYRQETEGEWSSAFGKMAADLQASAHRRPTS